MEITASDPARIVIELAFRKPVKATNQIEFVLTPRRGGTDVDWRMTGRQQGLWAAVGRVFPMDKMVGGDFERGLARLKTAAEA